MLVLLFLLVDYEQRLQSHDSSEASRRPLPIRLLVVATYRVPAPALPADLGEVRFAGKHFAI